MEIKIDSLKEINIYPPCLGSRRILAMQSVVTKNGATKNEAIRKWIEIIATVLE